MRNFNKVTLIHWKYDSDKHPFGSHMIFKDPETTGSRAGSILSYPIQIFKENQNQIVILE